ncbi:MAG: pentapeptide repeat-containing protein [Planctomycetota bacterium]
MVDPAVAPVRPRVHSHETGASLLLEDVVATVVSSYGVGTLRLDGEAGAGKSMALRHLAATIDPALNVALLDDADVEVVAREAESRFVVFSSQSKARLGMSRRLAPWTNDDVIEYLLSERPELIQSVYSRFLSATDHRVKNPELCCLILEEFCEHRSMSSTAEAILSASARLMPPEITRDAVGAFCVRALKLKPDRVFPAMLQLIRFLRSIESVDLFRRGLARLLRHRVVQAVLAAKHFADQLRAKNAGSLSPLPIHRDVVTEVVTHVHHVDQAMNALRRIANSNVEVSPLAASVLLACQPEWRPKNASPTFAGALLADANWNNIFLREADFKGTDLSQADFANSKLEKVDAEFSWLETTSFHGARIDGTSFTAATMTGCRFGDASLEDVSFANSDLRHADFSNASLRRCGFTGADLSDASFLGAELTNCNLTGAILEGTDFRNARLRNAKLQGLSLRRALLDEVDFHGSRLERCDLENIQAHEILFHGADLRGAYLTGSRLPGADFRNADLSNTGLGDIDWENADLRGADLCGCTFHMGSTRSGLVESLFPSEGTRTGFYTDDYDDQYFKAPEEIRKANLCGADLRDAKIQDVDFYLVDLRGALYDDDQAIHLRRTGAILRSRAK